MDKKCLVCDKMYFAKRKDSQYCSPSCRKKASRDINDEIKEQPKPSDNKRYNNYGDRLLPDGTIDHLARDDNGKLIPIMNTAQKLTQQQIEERYTLKNYGRLQYSSSANGGGFSYSPYKQANPLSQAYTLKD